MDHIGKQDIPLYVAELVFGEHPFVTPSPPANVTRMRGRDILWHKERLLNILLAAIPKQFTKLAWVDADAIFTDVGWYDQASARLDSFPIVQLFERLEQRDNVGKFAREYVGLAAYVASGSPDPFNFGELPIWPGVGWAANRTLLEKHGLFDKMIVGGGDTLLSFAAFSPDGNRQREHLDHLPDALTFAWANWATGFHGDVQGRVGFVPGTVVQLGHGTRQNRRYMERLEILKRHRFDPSLDIEADEHGVWRWASDKPELHSDVREYFRLRHEDDD